MVIINDFLILRKSSACIKGLCTVAAVIVLGLGYTNYRDGNSVLFKTDTGVKTEIAEVSDTAFLYEPLMVNINTADIAELSKLDGIGEAFGERIIAYRNENGPFKAIEDIKNVKGIGDKTFEKIKNSITIGE